ncbi:MAG: YcgN family cysteine cluster protein [Pseudomonadota bacterium]
MINKPETKPDGSKQGISTIFEIVRDRLGVVVTEPSKQKLRNTKPKGDQENAQPYWKTKKLSEMTKAEWESLCDGCGKCCMVLIEDDETETIWETDVACRLYDADKRVCTDYSNRHRRVPDCVRLTPENASALPWMPETCAYRRIARGQSLPEWHPLVTGDPQSTARAGAAASKFLISEDALDEEEIFSRKSIERPDV